ncbi:response regulator transcription factor [Robbsia sp. Bb-Pol-6]|uniref:Response regulator transcription factor n=1 Tax=Robbsia betulipollinis TaxID=2981849 RepID=A0ABT3ZNJ3_9BURK|nr:response regulator transcription factor [Robbsia betulipollinis]MCY0388099.1 response regulator transcription factor [Robbsia betulipollinis]
MHKKRIAIVDDHAFIRLGMRMLLERQSSCDGDVDVVAEAADGVQGWQLVRDGALDLVLLDINLPGLDGYDMLARIGRMERRPKVLVVSASDGLLPVRRALAAGADGFLCKSEAPLELLRGVAAVLAGHCFIPRGALRVLAPPGARGEALSPRERCIAEGLVEGRSNKAIAHALGLSAKTISAHKRNIFRKLGVRNLIELVDCLRSTDSYGVRRATAREGVAAVRESPPGPAPEDGR